MRTQALLVLAISCAAFVSPSLAQTASPAAAPTSADPDRVVCHSLPPPTGSRLGSRSVCHTQREWDQIRQHDAEVLNSMQMKGMETTPPGH